MVTSRKRSLERGATALIIVMFSVLLFITITVSFMKLMNDEQTRTNDNELSQGAYDSALAGIEDGKRVLSACMANPAGPACAAISASRCTTISDAGFVDDLNGEVYLKTNLGADGTDFEQAYTCVKISPNTPDYKETIPVDGSLIVPLITAPGEFFDKVVVSWFMKDDSTNPIAAPSLDILPSVTLPQFANWAGTKPPIIRAQLMQFNKNSFSGAHFDSTNGASTLYLYPKSVGTSSINFANDGRRVGDAAPTSVRCNANYSGFGGYACSVEISLPDPVGGSPVDRTAYLRLTSLYNATKIKVEMQKTSGQPVEFFNVQPSIDSTGRAADVFRRVEGRVELVDPNQDLLFPRATIDITNNFCKAFRVTNNLADYQAGSCNPLLP